MIGRRTFLRSATAATATVMLTASYARFVEPYWIDFTSRDMPINNLPSRWIGRRLVHLSDLHIGTLVPDDYLRSVFDRVRQVDPDVVLCTGDWTSHHDDIFSQCEAMFEHLPSGRIGTFGVLGNHDYASRWRNGRHADQLAGLVENAGVTILRNESVTVDGLTIVGMDDLWSRRFDPHASLRSVRPTDPAITMVHNPDCVNFDGWDNQRGWILAGHTHGGQCKPPLLPPPRLPIRDRRFANGAFDLGGGRHLYVSRGVGHTLPVRFNVRPEVTVFNLRQADSSV